MKSELKNIFKRLEEFCAKPITDTVEFLMICLVLFVFRFILTGAMMCFDELHIFIYFSILILSFAINCIANANEKFEGTHHWSTIVVKLVAYICYAHGFFLVLALQ